MGSRPRYHDLPSRRDCCRCCSLCCGAVCIAVLMAAMLGTARSEPASVKGTVSCNDHSCFFAGAVHRSFNENASKLGIHRPYLEVPLQETAIEKVEESYVQALKNVRTYFREMNVSEQLAEAMFRIEPENVRFLNEKAAGNYG